MSDSENIPKEYLDDHGVLNAKGLAKYKSGSDMEIKGKQVEIEEPEPKRID